MVRAFDLRNLPAWRRSCIKRTPRCLPLLQPCDWKASQRRRHSLAQNHRTAPIFYRGENSYSVACCSHCRSLTLAPWAPGLVSRGAASTASRLTATSAASLTQAHGEHTSVCGLGVLACKWVSFSAWTRPQWTSTKAPCERDCTSYLTTVLTWPRPSLLSRQAIKRKYGKRALGGNQRHGACQSIRPPLCDPARPLRTLTNRR